MYININDIYQAMLRVGIIDRWKNDCRNVLTTIKQGTKHNYEAFLCKLQSK